MTFLGWTFIVRSLLVAPNLTQWQVSRFMFWPPRTTDKINHETSSRTKGSGCGTVGRAVATDTRDPRFESQHQQKFIC